jgi:hypothetical protein
MSPQQMTRLGGVWPGATGIAEGGEHEVAGFSLGEASADVLGLIQHDPDRKRVGFGMSLLG